MKSKKISWKLFGLALLLTIIISNFIEAGKSLDNLRENVLRMHILANSDSIEDQSLKLEVRNSLLEHSDEIFGENISFDSFCEVSSENIEKIRDIAQDTVNSNGYDYHVDVEETKMFFNERTYGDITMPQGEYSAIRVTIGKAEGHNWWCVMYPPLCLPAAEKVTDNKSAEEFYFTETEQDIMKNPQKYEIRFMLWDKIKDIF